MTDEDTAPTPKAFSGSQVALIVLIAVLATVGACFWFYKTYISPAAFQPVVLSGSEQAELDGKLRRLGVNPLDLLPQAPREEPVDASGRLIPEKYVENPADRDIELDERELNAIVASNPELASRFAIDLAKNLASAKLLIPLDPDLPVMGGRTLRITAGIELAYAGDRPVVKLRGVSVMGIPVPNAWLGNLKNIDLVEQFGSDPGFWHSFAAGIQLIEVEDGRLHIRLQE